MSDKLDDNLDPDYAELEYDDGLSAPEIPERSSSGRKSFAAGIKSQPVFRIILILLPVAVVSILAVVLLGFQQKAPESRVSGASSNLSDPPLPSKGEVSPLIEKATNEDSLNRAERAIRDETSSIPTPMATPEQVPDLVTGQINVDVPLERWRNDLVRDPPAPPPEQVTVTVPAAAPAPEPIVIDLSGLSQAMATQMGTILQSRVPTSMKVISVPSPATTSTSIAGGETGNSEVEGQNAAPPEPEGKIIISAGSIYSGRTLIASDSDVPGPVLVEIANGPFRGGRAIGEFTSNEKLLTLNFSTVVFKGQSYSVNAIALDPETSLAGLASDVDNRYFSRVVLPTAAAFITGFTEAVGQSATTVQVQGDTVIQNQDELDVEEQLAEGANVAAEEISSLLNDNEDQEPRVTIDSGTSVALLFTEEVLTTSLTSNLPAEEETPSFQQFPGQFQNPFFGQPFPNQFSGQNFGQFQNQQNNDQQQQNNGQTNNNTRNNRNSRNSNTTNNQRNSNSSFNGQTFGLNQ